MICPPVQAVRPAPAAAAPRREPRAPATTSAVAAWCACLAVSSRALLHQQLGPWCCSSATVLLLMGHSASPAPPSLPPLHTCPPCPRWQAQRMCGCPGLTPTARARWCLAAPSTAAACSSCQMSVPGSTVKVSDGGSCPASLEAIADACRRHPSWPCLLTLPACLPACRGCGAFRLWQQRQDVLPDGGGRDAAGGLTRWRSLLSLVCGAQVHAC